MAPRKKKSEPKDKTGGLNIPKMNIETMDIILIGDTPLISHAWSDEVKTKMLDKMMGLPEGETRAPKDPQKEYENSLYPMPGGKFGHPIMAFKKAWVGAGRYVEGFKMTELRGLMFVVGGPLVWVEGTPRMRGPDPVTVGQTTDLRFRGEFETWRVRLTVKFNASNISRAQVINLFQIAGFAVGVGDWRPECDGPYGTWHVAGEDEL